MSLPAWELDPGVVIPLAISAVLYALGSRKHFGLTRLQRACFWAGWLTLAIALISPLHQLGEVLFSAHMVQHEILMIISAPLLVLSRPLVTFLWALPMNWRRALGRWSQTDPIRSSWIFLAAPLTAWWIHAVAIWLWYVPPLFRRLRTSRSADCLCGFLPASFISSRVSRCLRPG